MIICIVFCFVCLSVNIFIAGFISEKLDILDDELIKFDMILAQFQGNKNEAP